MIRGSEQRLAFGIVRVITRAGWSETSRRRLSGPRNLTAFSLAAGEQIFTVSREANQRTGRCARLKNCGTVVEPFGQTLRLSSMTWQLRIVL